MTFARLNDFAKRRLPFPRGRTVRRLPGQMNQSEARYAKHLEWRKVQGEVAAYWYEPFRLRLATNTGYHPDFLVMLADGRLELHELKGFMEDDAAVKLKVTSEVYWIFPVYVVREKPRNVWTLREVGR